MHRTSTSLFRLGAVALGFTILACGHPSLALAGQKPRLDPALARAAGQLKGRSRVIVEFSGTPDPRAITESGGVAGRGLQGSGAGTRAQAAEINNFSLATLASDPRVARIIPDRGVFATLERTSSAIGLELARRHSDLTGRGIGVAIIDSGVTAWHDDLYLTRTGDADPRVVHFKDFTNPASSGWASERPNDPYGHGTHVTGIVAGTGYDSGGRRTGIAPGARIVSLKVLDENGAGYVSDAIAAIDYAIAVRKQFNIRVINLSVASGVFESFTTDPFAQATRRAVDAGIVVVTSAGNLGVDQNDRPQFGGITSPGNSPWVITVGAASHNGTAIRSDDHVARFSSRGPTLFDRIAKPDLVAYGVGIESTADANSTLYNTYPDTQLSGTRPGVAKPYQSLSGTSMAAPVVSGTIALMLEANPSLTPNAIKAILEFTAENRAENPIAEGAGLLNAQGAIRLARFFDNPLAKLGQRRDLIEGRWSDWSGQVLWGNQLFAGGMLLPGSSAWSTSVPWGATATSNGKAIVWGVAADDNIVWSTRHDDNIVWSTRGDDNIVWSTRGDDNIVWSTRGDDNIVWSTRGDDNIVWSTRGDDNIVWSTAADNIVWSTASEDNIVWSTAREDNIVWSTAREDNIVWSTRADDNIVWSTRADDNIVWSTAADDNIVWSTGGVTPIVWPAPAAVIPRQTPIPGY